MSTPDQLELIPLERRPHVTVHVPGSKSITNRALVLAALASHSVPACRLDGVLHSEDTQVMADALRGLGFDLDVDGRAGRVTVRSTRPDRVIPAKEANLFVANSGTTMRFLTALVALGQGRYRLDGVARMRERPIGDLLDALAQLGVRARCENGNGYPPVVMDAAGLQGGPVAIKGDVSSQFLSGLLMAAPFADNDVTITLLGPLVSVPYVTMTLTMMQAFGARVATEGLRVFHIPGRQRFMREAYSIEPDASAASYFFGAAAVTGGSVTVAGLTQGSLQGDLRFIDLLEKMGCRVEHGETGITIHGASLRGIDVDMSDISDTVMTLAAVACFAEGPTTIRNVAHIRHKETDRLAALATELRRVGAEVEERSDGLTIVPRPLHGAVIETYRDHRMAMSLALVGLKVAGIVIKDPGCVAKTYPDFFKDWERLR